MKLLAVAWKDFKVLLKDSEALITLFLLPFVFITVMTLALGGMFGGGDMSGSPVKIPVANEDKGALAQAVVDQLANTKGFQVETEGPESGAFTRGQVEKMVSDGKRSLALVFPADFSEKARRFEPTSVTIILDPAAPSQLVGPVRGTLQGILQQQLMTGLAPAGIELWFQQSLPPGPQNDALKKQLLEGMQSFTGEGQQAGMASLVTIEEANPPGMTVKKYPTSIQHNAPGYTVMFVFFIVLALANSILTEKQEGTFRRLLAAPLSKAALLAGKLLPYYVVVLLQVAIMFAVARFLFGMELGDLPGLLLITLALGAAATSLGLMVSALGKTYAQVSGIATLIILVMAAIGGSMVPLFVMPQFMQDLARITPHFWAITGYQDVLVRGLGLGEVLVESGVLVAFAAAFFAIALWRFRFD